MAILIFLFNYRIKLLIFNFDVQNKKKVVKYYTYSEVI